MLCRALGVFASAHADGKLYLRLLPNLQAGEGQTVTVGDPVKELTSDKIAVIQVLPSLPRALRHTVNCLVIILPSQVHRMF